MLQYTNEDDCWIIVDNKVYNVTKYIQHHPCGKFIILRHAGTDCSVHFKFHSYKARQILEAYKIGYVKEYIGILFFFKKLFNI